MAKVPFYKTRRGGAVISALIPGLGLWLRGYPDQGIFILGISTILSFSLWAMGSWGGAGAGNYMKSLKEVVDTLGG